MNLKSRKLAAIASFCFMFIFIFFRENLLLEINALLIEKPRDRSYSYWFSETFQLMSKQELYAWKWGISLSFTFLISFFTVLCFYTWFKNKEYTRLLMLSYLFVFVLIFITSTIGYFTVGFAEVYPFLRKVLGVLHSSIPFFLFFLLFYWKTKHGEELQ